VKRLLVSCLVAMFPLLAAQPIASPYYSADEYQNARSLFGKIRADLNRAAENDVTALQGDGARFAIARMQIGQLENHWEQAHFDTNEFDNTYTALRMVLNDNRLTGHDRDALSADESRLLEFRSEYY
jgi:hypothetical protein